MASVNKCIFIGNCTKDPELKYLASGDAMVNLTIACNDSWKDKNGEKKEIVEYINLTFFQKLAEIVGQYLKKGSAIYVEGKMTTRKYTDANGVEKYATSIKVDRMQMLDGKQRSDDQSPQPQQPQQRSQQANAYRNQSGGQAARPAPNFDDDDFSQEIPF